MWPFPKTVNEANIVNFDYKPSISEFRNLTEQFKGQVEQNIVRFPKELGEEHPFDFKQMEELYKKFGFFTAVVDKYVDFVVGPGFYIKCDDERAKTIIEDFMRDVNLDNKLRAWTKEALVKGNGFMEIGGDKKEGVKGLKVLNANYMYVVRDNKGNIKSYNQYTGAFDKFTKTKVIPFTDPNNIAHFAFNIVGDCAYGLGIGVTALRDVNNLLQNEKDVHYLQERKANAPLHAKLGKVDGNVKIIPKTEDITSFGQKMEIMSNKTNWATDDLVELKVIDFGNIGEKFSALLDYDIQKLFYIFQIPPELMGMANIPEGMAQVRMDAFQRRIQSIQAEMEKIIEEQIFKRVLEANGFDIHVEFEWGAPSTIEIEGRMQLISELVKSPMTSMAMREILENELIKLLKLDMNEWELAKEEAEQEQLERELEQPQPIVPGQNKNFPQRVMPKSEQPKQPKPQEKIKESKKKIKYISKNYEYKKDCPHCLESFENINDIEEWVGFKYKTYLKQIHEALAVYDFDMIRAVTEAEYDAGYLTSEQVEDVRGILDNGFAKGLGIKEMSKQVDKIGLKDLYRMTNDGEIKIGAAGTPILAKTAEKRSIGIVRSEVTRMANIGAVEYYKQNGVEKVSWIASIGDRTCELCEERNGQIYNIGEELEIPLHPLCRCTYAPVIELQ